MIRLPFSEDMVERAKEKALTLGSINNSILQGKGNIAGYLGEEALAPFVNAEIVSNNRGLEKYNHDLLLGNSDRLEVKTKRRTVSPKGFYDVSIAETSAHQRPDLYAFISLEFSKTTKAHPKTYYGLKNIWLCGFITAERFWNESDLWKKGKIDTRNNFKTHVNMYNLEIRNLHKDLTGIAI